MATTKKMDAAFADSKQVTDTDFVMGVTSKGEKVKIAKADLAKVVGGLQTKYVNITALAELDSLNYENTDPTVVYLVTKPSDYDSTKYPFGEIAQIRISKLGGTSTVQSVFDFGGKSFYRMNIGGTWSSWTSTK